MVVHALQKLVRLGQNYINRLRNQAYASHRHPLKIGQQDEHLNWKTCDAATGRGYLKLQLHVYVVSHLRQSAQELSYNSKKTDILPENMATKEEGSVLGGPSYFSSRAIAA